jgi:hypothetical protein
MKSLLRLPIKHKFAVFALLLVVLLSFSANSINTNHATCVSVTYPSYICSGQRGELSIAVRNSGLNLWSNYLGYSLLNQNPGLWGVNQVQLPDNIIVFSGDHYIFDFQIMAPNKVGLVKSNWAMQGPSGMRFSDFCSNTINVIDCSNPSKYAVKDPLDNYSVNFSDFIVNHEKYEPTCMAGGPSESTVLFNATSHTVYAYGVKDAARVLFAVWSDENDQDDLSWYDGINNGNTTWTYEIDLDNHPGTGIINVQIYTVNDYYGETWCDTINFVRDKYVQKPLPTIEYFKLEDENVKIGTPVTLIWNVTNASTVNISGGIGNKSSSGWHAIILEEEATFILTASNPNGVLEQSLEVKLKREDKELVKGPLNCDYAGPDYIAINPEQKTHTLYANGVKNAKNVIFSVWSEENDKDDIVYYDGINLGDGIWKYELNLENHPEKGVMKVNVYMYGSDSQEKFCDTSNFFVL